MISVVVPRISSLVFSPILSLLLLLLAHLSVADLPSHCLHGDVLGQWRVHSGQWHPCEDNLAVVDPFCGYALPDNPSAHASSGLVPPKVSPQFKEREEDSFNVIFTPKHTIDPETSNQDTDADLYGSYQEKESGASNWTIVYDEGMDWTYKGRHYFAYFKYANVYTDSGVAQLARSFCGTTMIGWWRDAENHDQTGCWWGQKLLHRDRTPVDPNQWTNELPINRPSLMEIGSHDFSAYAMRPGGIQELVQKLLLRGSPTDEGAFHWKPINTSYVMIGNDKVASIPHLNRLIGTPRRFAYEEAGAQTVSRFFPYGSLDLTVQDFDWSNPDDVHRKIGVRISVVPSVISQGTCGSCYALTAASMLTSRLWIKYAADPSIVGKVHVSSYPMTSCTPLSQGCKGGYIYLALNAASSRRDGLPTAECVKDYDYGVGVDLGDSGLSMTSISETAGSQSRIAMLPNEEQKCYDLVGTVAGSTLKCLLPPFPRMGSPKCRQHRVRVKKYGYVGGSFGHGSEKAMRDSLLRYGPLATSIEPTPEFAVYESGVFHTPFRFIGEYRKDDESYRWMKVDHAVIVIGFGVQIDPYSGKRVPYWKVQNSWGDAWGEQGNFKVVRGLNEIGVESSPVEGEPELWTSMD